MCQKSSIKLHALQAFGLIVGLVLSFNAYQTWFVPPDSEEDLINDITNIRQRIYSDFPIGQTKRDSHVKAPAVLMGEFTISPDVPKELKIGMFAEANKTFSCWVRVSNAVFGPGQADALPDPRGLAIKLIDAKGESLHHDFIMLSLPRMPFGLAEHFKWLAAARRDDTMWWFALRLLMTGRIGDILWQAQAFSKQVYDSLLAIPYWSVTPYALGSDIILKYTMKPTSTYVTPKYDPKVDKDDADYLQHRIITHLEKADATYDFFVQIRNNRAKQPIDDLSVIWEVKDSPLIKVASLRIPKGEKFLQNGDMGDNMSFSPGNTFPEHHCVGKVNRIRAGVYKKMQALRHNRDGKKDFI